MKNTTTERAMSTTAARDILSEMPYDITFHRFRSCNAYVSVPFIVDGKVYRAVKSYSTIVAIVDIYNDTFTEFGKYSVTTSKQVTQIYNDMFNRITTREFNPCHL